MENSRQALQTRCLHARHIAPRLIIRPSSILHRAHVRSCVIVDDEVAAVTAPINPVVAAVAPLLLLSFQSRDVITVGERTDNVAAG